MGNIFHKTNYTFLEEIIFPTIIVSQQKSIE
jgi:hypothetical protein